jgi:hypothetical protein
MAWGPEEANLRGLFGWVVAADPDQPDARVLHLPRRRAIWYMSLDVTVTVACRGDPITVVWLARLDDDAPAGLSYALEVRSRPGRAVEPVALAATRTLPWAALAPRRGHGWFYVAAPGFHIDAVPPGGHAVVTAAWHNRQYYQFGLWFRAVLVLPSALVGDDSLPPDRTIWVRGGP